ncbi:MAG: hypothetical protein CVV41_21765 [Candidatus Riflebacteria bacterium HGW-Riflebacteria-1]|jgi:ElaB/YqjD/DUF883 family membrane-anchored ribosome-binding protein|nr:MAG: hypothetical protein CVV41_21765 [Candidatus Riflebacteria bacterium HGW-Riflebacteria-1]
MDTRLLDISYDHFRFLAATGRQKVYLVILSSLYDERLAHQIEIFHDDLYLKVTPKIESLCGESYHEALFRQDIDQLVEWGNIDRKLEGRRVRSLSDNSLRRNILKITETTFQLMRFLLQQSRPDPGKTAARGFLLLEDLNAMLDELEKLVASFHAGQRSEIALQRSQHVIESMDAKIDDAVAELTGLADQLHSFLDDKSGFESERYETIMSQLTNYNQAYLSRLNTMVDRIFSRLCALERHQAFADFIAALNLGDDLTAGAATPAGNCFQLMLAFFDPGSGRLDFYCRRVHAELYDALRRIRNYLRIRRDKTLRVEEIRNRIAEMLSAPEEDCFDWVDRLYSSVVVPMLLADGTPAEKSVAPLPRRSSSRIGATAAAQAISAKVATPEESRELETRRVARINEFFLNKVLRGLNESPVHDAEFENIDDLKTYMQGLKLSLGKIRKLTQALQVSFERPPAGADAAAFDLADCKFDCPDHLIRRKAND